MDRSTTEALLICLAMFEQQHCLGTNAPFLNKQMASVEVGYWAWEPMLTANFGLALDSLISI